MDFAVTADISNRVVGIGSAVVCLCLIQAKWGDPVAMVALIFLALVCICDGLWLKVPNALTATMFFLALGYGAYSNWPAGAGFALAGFVVGFGIYLLPYCAGWFGGGDLKAAAALGTLIGPLAVLQVALFGAIAGGVLSMARLVAVGIQSGKLGTQYAALGASIATRRLEYLRAAPGMQRRFSYGPALALGYVALVVWGGMF